MSLEKNIGRIADALEALVAQGNSTISGGEAAPVVIPDTATVTDTPKPVKRATPAVAPAPANTAAPKTAPLASVPLSDEEMNNALVAEFKRFGNREVIDAEMAKLGVTSVVGMTAENQNALLTAVRAFES